MIRNRNHTGFRLAVLVVLLMAVIGCGVKQPPVPPQAAGLPPVTGLEAGLEGDEVYLRWRLPAEQMSPRGVVGDFWVYRARIEKSKQGCLDCPVLFKRIANVSGERGQERNGGELEFSFRETVDSGFQYQYKIKPITPGGTAGADSNTATIDY